MSQKITCPSCKTEIDLWKLNQDTYKAELEKEFEKEREDMRKKAQLFAEQKMQEQAKKDAVEMQDLKNRLEEEAKKREELQKWELELRKQRRELEEKSKQTELDMARKLDEERQKIEKRLSDEMSKSQEMAIKNQVAEAQRVQAEEFRKKELEFLKQQDQLKRSLDDAKRKAEQGSQQIQWDIQEDDLKLMLSQTFPIDSVEDVATWVKWADLIQTVKNSIGRSAWIIVWESKNTKSWQDTWVLKLKDDSLKSGGNICILVTSVLPKSVQNFAMYDGVMVCLPEYALAVASMLREQLLAIAKVETSLQWKDIKMEMLYKYLSSQEFSSKMTMMVDVFSELKIWIDSERRAMEKNWKKREKDLERATFAVTWMYGELESLMWQALPWSTKLELDSWEE